MKTTIKKMLSLVIVCVSMGFVSASAQTSISSFFDKKYENDLVTSITKYELANSGLYEKTTKSEFSYDELGNRVKQETFGWNDETNTWNPICCINTNYNTITNSWISEYALWNKSKAFYNEATERAIYQLDELGNITTLSMTKKGSEDLTVPMAILSNKKMSRTDFLTVN